MAFFAVFTTGLPSVSIPLNAYSVNFGDSIKIPCTISANPSVTNVFWERISQNGVSSSISLVPSKYSGGNVITPDLTIANTDTTDQGFYRCLATNSVGTSTSDSTFLTVVGSEFDMVGEIRKEQFLTTNK